MTKHKIYDIYKEDGEWKLYWPTKIKTFKFKKDAVNELQEIKKTIDIERVSNLQYGLYEYKRRCIESDCATPPSHRKLKIGDRVEIGNLKWNKILEVFDEGKYIKVLTITPKFEYGKLIGHEFRIWYRLWVDCLPYRNLEKATAPPRLERNKDIRFSYQQRTIDSLVMLYYGRSGLDLYPKYQRDFVWTIEQKKALIDSIFNNVDIGKFAIIRRPWGDDPHKPATPKLYEILDGKQRINAILEFLEDRYTYRGRYYSELNSRDQLHFDDYSISYAETDHLTATQKYRYFLNLNTSGTPVDPKHMEKIKEMLKNEEK
jgi:hypothetical protein